MASNLTSSPGSGALGSLALKEPVCAIASMPQVLGSMMRHMTPSALSLSLPASICSSTRC